MIEKTYRMLAKKSIRKIQRNMKLLKKKKSFYSNDLEKKMTI